MKRSSLLATGLALAFVTLVLVGLIDWAGAPDAVRVKPVSGASEDLRADNLAQPEKVIREAPMQITEWPGGDGRRDANAR